MNIKGYDKRNETKAFVYNEMKNFGLVGAFYVENHYVNCFI